MAFCSKISQLSYTTEEKRVNTKLKLLWSTNKIGNNMYLHKKLEKIRKNDNSNASQFHNFIGNGKFPT